MFCAMIIMILIFIESECWKMKKNMFLRIIFYVAGLLILALGIILNTKSGLGVSPIISVAYSIATIGGFNFGNITFLLYSVFVVVEIVLRCHCSGSTPGLKAGTFDGSSAAAIKSCIYSFYEPVFRIASGAL